MRSTTAARWLLILGFIGLASAGRSWSEVAPSFKVLTWNVLYDQAQAKQRLPALLDAIAACEADVIATQEAMPWFVDALLADARFSSYRAASIDGTRAEAEGCCLVSRLPLTKTRVMWLPSRYGRKALLAEVPALGVQWTIATVHLDSLKNDGPRRALQLDAVFDAMKPAEHALLVGDFNFGDGAAEAQHLDPAYVDAWRMLRPQEVGFTWNVELNPLAHANSEEGEGSARIDHVLVRSPAWVPVAISLVGVAPIGGGTVFPSDHFGLVATFGRR